jgi:hypothetical protein
MANLDGEFAFVVYLHRDDLEAAGFDSSQVDDETMRKLTAAIEEAYNETGYLNDLIEYANRLGIPKRSGE